MKVRMAKEGKGGMSTVPIRLLLVEEQALIRTALRKLLEGWTNIEIVAEAATKDETLSAIQRSSPDVTLLSLGHHDHTDLRVISDVARASGQSRLLVLVSNYDEEFRIQAVLQGAWGILERDTAPEHLQKAIQTVSDGKEIWLDRASLAVLLTQVWRLRWHGSEGPLTSLSKRERDVLEFLRTGCKNKHIGEKLFISETTVRHHVTAIFQKLNVSNRFELIARLHGHGVADLTGRSRDSYPAPSNQRHNILA